MKTKIAYLGAALLALAACNNDATSPTVSLAGDYTLRTVNGSSLPFTFSDGATVMSDVITLRNDGSFSESTQLADGRVLVDQGFYNANGNAITFNDVTIGETYSASLSGSVLTAFFPGGPTEVFQKM